jgi:hypothetical protein
LSAFPRRPELGSWQLGITWTSSSFLFHRNRAFVFLSLTTIIFTLFHLTKILFYSIQTKFMSFHRQTYYTLVSVAYSFFFFIFISWKSYF